MKLIIEDKFVHWRDATLLNMEILAQWEETLKKFSVYIQRNKPTKRFSVGFTIIEQVITLDDVDMNTVLGIFSDLFEFKLIYSYEGEGCGVTLTMWDKDR